MTSSTSTSNPQPHVLILGAGLGGLTLAQCLRKKGVSFQIFERDKNVNARSTGWAIALHTILSDLKEALPEDVPPIESTNHLLPLDLPAELCFYNSAGKASAKASSEHPVVRANRQKLRELLTTNIDIEWDKMVSSIEQTQSSVKLMFGDGTVATGDVLVGADGANSYVRNHLLPSSKPRSLPAGTINGELKLSGESFNRQLALANSAYVAAAENYHIYVGLSHLPESTEAKYYWFLNFYDNEAAKDDEQYWTASASKQTMYDFVVEKTRSLGDKFTEIVRRTKVEDIVTPPIKLKDLELDGIPEGRVTLLGDAAHPMAPFRGEGGSHALEDALRLSRILASIDVDNDDFIPKLLKTYEEEMLPRGRDAVRRSRAVLDSKKETGTTVAWGQPLKFETA